MEQKISTLEIPLEFKIACTIYNFSIRKVLQIFIDHVSFYDSISYQYNGCYSLATNTILEHVAHDVRGLSPAFANKRENSIKYIRQLVTLAMEPGLTERKKRNRSIPFIDKLYGTITPNTVKSTKFYLDEGTVLELNKDFCILCEVHNQYPEEYLELFMRNISLAENTARVKLGIPSDNMAMAFFLQLMGGYGGLTGRLPRPALLIDFTDKMQELHLKTFIVRDLARRKEMYQELYISYYLKLIKAF